MKANIWTALRGAINAYRIRRNGEYLHNVTGPDYDTALWRYRGKLYALAPVSMVD